MKSRTRRISWAGGIMIIVGTTALEYWGFSPRKAKDIDYWYLPEIGKPKIGDCKPMPWEILSLIPTCEYDNYATPDAIYTIKRSHAMYDIHWDKTISDIIYLKRKGCKLITELHEKLIEYWKTIHGDKSFLSLNKSKKDFFNDYVDYKIDHDLLHNIVASPNAPLYNKCLKTGKEVLIDKDKFNQLTNLEQINLFREEVYVIALERGLIPTNFKLPIYKAYRLALKKTVTNLTKGWATQFILDNIENYVKMNGQTWLKNYLIYSGKDLTMHPIIEKVKDKAEEFNLNDRQIENILHHEEMTQEPDANKDWFKNHPEDLKEAQNEYEFCKFLKSIGYKLIEREGGGDMLLAHTVVELEGVLFRADYGYQSYDGYYIDDVWDWNEVQKKTKEVVIYE